MDTEYETVQFWGMRITKWALSVLIAGSISALSIILVGAFTSAGMGYFISASVLLLLTILGTYIINCLQIGRCDILSKVLVVIYVIQFVLFMLIHLGIGFFNSFEMQKYDYLTKNVDSISKSIKKTIKGP